LGNARPSLASNHQAAAPTKKTPRQGGVDTGPGGCGSGANAFRATGITAYLEAGALLGMLRRRRPTKARKPIHQAALEVPSCELRSAATSLAGIALLNKYPCPSTQPFSRRQVR
jgi:hypothetical protein